MASESANFTFELEETLKSINVEEYINSNNIGINQIVKHIIDTGNNKMLRCFIDKGLDLSRKVGEEFVSIIEA